MNAHVAAERSLSPRRTSNYVQAIPIYLASDVEVARYFRDCRDEIDAFTGTNIIVLVPQEVEQSDAKGIADTIGGGVASRFGTLRFTDLPCLWVEDEFHRTGIIRLPEGRERISHFFRSVAEVCQYTKNTPDIIERIDALLERDIIDRTPWLKAILRRANLEKAGERKLALFFGVIFVAAILAISLFIPRPTPFQYTIFRIVLALAAGGFVSMTPGFIEAHVGKYVRAGGALAVFVIVYFYAPAALGGV